MLGSVGEDLSKEFDLEVYSDFDFYQQLLQDFLKAHEHDELDEGSDAEREKEFLGNADLSITQKYLEKRKRLQE